jgi:hypothetical protein
MKAPHPGARPVGSGKASLGGPTPTIGAGTSSVASRERRVAVRCYLPCAREADEGPHTSLHGRAERQAHMRQAVRPTQLNELAARLKEGAMRGSFEGRSAPGRDSGSSMLLSAPLNRGLRPAPLSFFMRVGRRTAVASSARSLPALVWRGPANMLCEAIDPGLREWCISLRQSALGVAGERHHNRGR